jgi:hypothetical protein
VAAAAYARAPVWAQIADFLLDGDGEARLDALAAQPGLRRECA